MAPWLKRFLTVVGVFALSWTAAILLWRATMRVPSTADLALGMLGLPVGLLMACWAVGKGVTLARNASAARAAAPAAATEPAAPAPSLPPPIDIVAAALRMPHGASPEALAQAMTRQRARLDLDQELTDGDGFPVLAGRVPEADADAQRETMAPWLAAQDLAHLRFSEEQLRALAMATDVTAELALHAALHEPLAETVPPTLAETATSATQPTPAARAAAMQARLPLLDLAVLLPQHWEAPLRAAAAEWLLHVARQQGWPAERATLYALAGQGAFDTIITEAATPADRAGPPRLTLLLACDSSIGHDTVHDWAQRGLLFTAHNPQGLVPGEGAAALLLAAPRHAAALYGPSQVRLHGAAMAQRATSADEDQRGERQLLGALAAQAMQQAAVDSAGVTLISADTDTRSGRVDELMAAAGAVLPELDLGKQAWSVAAACGHATAVPALAALALAHQHARDKQEYALCVSNLDPWRRYAALLGPASPALSPSPTPLAS